MEQNWERGRQGVAVRTRELLLWYWWCHQCTWAVNDTCWEQSRLYEISNMWALRDTQGLSSSKGVRHEFLHTCCKENLVPGEGQGSRISAKTVSRDRRIELQRRGKDREQLGCDDDTGERLIDLLSNTEGKSQLFQGHNGQRDLMSSLCWNLGVMLRWNKEQQWNLRENVSGHCVNQDSPEKLNQYDYLSILDIGTVFFFILYP